MVDLISILAAEKRIEEESKVPRPEWFRPKKTQEQEMDRAFGVIMGSVRTVS